LKTLFQFYCGFSFLFLFLSQTEPIKSYILIPKNFNVISEILQAPLRRKSLIYVNDYYWHYSQLNIAFCNNQTHIVLNNAIVGVNTHRFKCYSNVDEHMFWNSDICSQQSVKYGEILNSVFLPHGLDIMSNFSCVSENLLRKPERSEKETFVNNDLESDENVLPNSMNACLCDYKNRCIISQIRYDCLFRVSRKAFQLLSHFNVMLEWISQSFINT